ncbi:MAG: hypothetical protein Q4Q58_06775 [Thermoplasmata archaeon]|nr:hypothetical protein [Thermoplasmata archaeon]
MSSPDATEVYPDGYPDGYPEDPPGVPEQAYAEPPRRRPLPAFVKVVLAVAAGAAAVYVAYTVFGAQALLDFAWEYWPAVLAPFAGIALARFVVRSMYRPSGRVLLNLDVENHLVRAVFIPDDMMRYLNQTGNAVVYHTQNGTQVYLTSELDLANGFVDYGWVHTDNALVVMTREDAYVRWYRTLNEVLEENLQLMANPKVIGLGYARASLRKHLDQMSMALGLTDADYAKRDPADFPEDELDQTVRRQDGGGDTA